MKRDSMAAHSSCNVIAPRKGGNVPVTSAVSFVAEIRMPALIALTVAFLLSATVSFGQPKEIEPIRGVNRGQTQPAVATLLIGVNETAGGIAEPGWPLIVSAIRLPEDKPAPAALPTNISLQLTDERGTA